MKRETQRTNSEPTDLHDTSHVDASGYLRRGGYVFIGVWPRAGSGVVRMDPLRFLAGCRTRRLNQA